MKQCTWCGKHKEESEYYASVSGKNGLMSWCKECHRLKTGRQQRDQRYKISKKEYKRMLDDQGGVCAICGKKEVVKMKGKLKKLGVDHDHRCCQGQKRCGNCNRGLLCSHCNVGLGNLYDDPVLLHKALDYLAAWGVTSDL